MSFKENKYQQISINDRLKNLTEREQKFLNNSWAKPFAERIFPMIDESKFSVLYCNDNGRPNTPVNVIIGSLLLKELTQLTDEELLDDIMLDIRYQYALHLTSFAEIPFSDRTVSRFRERLYKHEMDTGEDLLKEEIERLSKELAKLMHINGKVKRMDSVMISSSCKNMGRLELIYTCVSNLVKGLVKAGQAENLPEHILKYADDSNKNAFCYRMATDEVSTRLESVTADALLIYELSATSQGVTDEFQLLERMLYDQTKDGVLKVNKEISPKSLQNPSDEDATLRRKAGKEYQGYVANVVEDCGENGSIITQYDYASNLKSDVEFAAEVIENLGEQEEPIILISDGAYASDENTQAAEENNINFATTNLTGQKPSESVLEFQTTEETIESCPEGHTPEDCTYNEEKDEYRAHFDKETCESCPRKEECPVIIQKKKAVVKLSKATIKRAKYVKKLSTEEYKAYSRTRNGVEGMPSVLRRRYGVDTMPVRGLVRSKMWFGFKIGAINIKRFIVAVFNTLFFIFMVRFTSKRCSFFYF